MTPVHKVACKILSILLHYPDREVWEHLAELEAEVERMSRDEVRKELAASLGEMRRRSLMDLQQAYTAAFDMNPATTLNMTYHRYGDTEKRAAALVRLRQAYRRAGFECTGAELPDYLPLMLEFLSECPDPSTGAFVWQSLEPAGSISEKLQADAPVYAGLLKAVAAILLTDALSPSN